ncbi:hypothetical protein F5B20DRAFT_117333 [Whalleya microplaca]|nr:hypothetical protein F5B20DRAFT_117333 [Whalleya microplaca]
MADPRYRYPSGRRSPTFNPARATMPVGIGHNSHYGGDLHAIPTARYDSTVPRRVNDHKTPVTPATTITTYNVTKDPVSRGSSHTSHTSSNTARHRSSTLDTGAVKPIIVTTNHPSRPHGTSSHTSSSTRVPSPTRDVYRSTDDAYYAQPASSIHSRGQNRHSSYGHGHTQSATLSNDEFYRLRERVGDDRLRAPARPPAEAYRHSRPHAIYTDPSHTATTTALVDYEGDGYEYTRPSDLARYDLDNDRRRSRRDSIDRPYYRPTVNVVTNETGRYDSRSRGPPPTSAGLDRYNRATAAGIYDRPTVTMPALPSVPAPPLIDTGRRTAPEGLRSPSVDRRSSRPRPVSLYQDSPARMSHPDDLYRSHDDERVHSRRDRDDPYYDDNVTSRGFGIRTDSIEQPETPVITRHDYDDRRTPRDVTEYPSNYPPDEPIDRARSRDSRKPADDTSTRADVSQDRKDNIGRKNSIGGRARDKVAGGLSVAAAAMGLAPRESSRDDTKGSPRRRDPEEDQERASSRTDPYKSKDKDGVERRASPREDPVDIEHRRESRREEAGSGSNSRERGLERERERELREREREREREPSRRDADAKLNKPNGDKRDDSPQSDGSASASRRRQRTSAAFNPTDTKGLMDLKAELAAMDGQDTQKEKQPTKDQTLDKDTTTTNGAERHSVESREESRGREVVPAREDKQVRLVSPPRDRSEPKPIKGILKQPKVKFPEEDNPVREGVAPHKDDKTKKDVPPGARWTRINRKMVSPAALEVGKERFEVRDDFVIVLRVLSKEEIQAYAIATAQIREQRRKEYEKEYEVDREYDQDHDRTDEERRSRRRRREEEYDYRGDRDRDDVRDRDRHRRHRRGSDSDENDGRVKAIEDGSSNHHRHRSYRDYDTLAGGSDDRR